MGVSTDLLTTCRPLLCSRKGLGITPTEVFALSTPKSPIDLGLWIRHNTPAACVISTHTSTPLVPKRLDHCHWGCLASSARGYGSLSFTLKRHHAKIKLPFNEGFIDFSDMV
jgi:hypothetical protein